MQLIVDIKNENIADKVLEFLINLKEDGVEIIKKDKFKADKVLDDEYVEKHWREIGMNTHSADMDDDERLYEAAARFYREKYSD